MQVEGRGVESQRVLRQSRDAEYAGRLVHVPDALLGPAQVGVRNRRAVAEVQLDVGPHGVPLAHGGTHTHTHTHTHTGERPHRPIDGL